ncbi:MAG: cobalamin-dependent protein [Nitrososphaerota archaeon]|nr:cobalamin-dependent protein [Nitrososphaerota archaeon]
MVYLRTKTVKGEKYLYLVKSIWDSKKNTSKQETIKYLGKASEITKDDIPPDYRNDKKIIAYLSSIDTFSIEEKEELLTKLKTQLYRHLIRGDFDSTKQLYDTYSLASGIPSFFEKILTPVMYQIGDMWAKNRLGIADEHVASNIANTLVKMINSKYTDMPTKKKIVICVPEGEEHNLGANILETHLSSIGHHVYNLTPTEPHDSIVNFIGSTKPDSIIVSITLEDNIKPGQRLVKKIRDRFDVPVYVGGQAIKDDQVRFENAQIIRDTSLKNIAKIITTKK